MKAKKPLSDKANPLISVIIPTFNRAALLPDALASVQAQNYDALQVIVVDDGSTDNSAEVLRSLDGKLEYIYQRNQGPAAARNTGLCHARGEWIAFLDSDDVWVAGRLHRQLALAAAYPTARVIWGMLQVAQQSEVDPTLFLPCGQPTLQTQLGSALMQRTLFVPTAIGQLDEALSTNDDVDWFCRLFEKNIEVLIHQEVVSFYRWHEANLVANHATSKMQTVHGLMHALARSLRRRRQQAASDLADEMKLNIHWVGV